MSAVEVGPRPLTTTEVAGLLRATGEAVEGELLGLGDDLASWHPAPGEWCAKECVGHMVEAEQRGFAGRIRLILQEPGRRLKSWDQVEVQKARDDCARPVAVVAAEFGDLRRASVDLVMGLAETDLELSGEHPDVGTLRVDELLHEWLHHDRNHFRQLEANVQAYVWASMGGARRFSEIEG